MSKNLFADFHNEYWFHVSNQDEIPIFGKIEKSIDGKRLYDIAKDFPDADTERVAYLKEQIMSDVTLVDTLRTIVGITDKRMYLELSYLFNKYRKEASSDQNILGESVYSLKKHLVSYFERLISKRSEKSDVSLSIITDYLEQRGVSAILSMMKKMSEDEVNAIVHYLLLPKEIQQEETKRRGHGAEKELADLLHSLGVHYLPEDKHENPMGSNDPNVDKKSFELAERDEKTTWSMDLIVKKGDALKVLIQGLVHTSDPGQYGVNKSGETVLVKDGINKHNKKVGSGETIELWGLVDGVGFIENPNNTIFKMLKHFDFFVQLKSLYKVGLKLHTLGMVKVKAIRFDMSFYTEKEANDMFALYGSEDIMKITDGTMPEGREIKAGKAWLYV